jgi:hypothetical protein
LELGFLCCCCCCCAAELDRMIADLYDRLHKLEAERDGIRPDCPHLEQLITLRKPAPAPPVVTRPHPRPWGRC